jgi:hypothetical protein
MERTSWRTRGAQLACTAYLAAAFAASTELAQSAQSPPAQSATPPSVSAAASPDPTSAAVGAESRWPLTIHGGSNTTLTLYQPQLDSWDGYKTSARIAVRAEIGPSTPPQAQFGVLTVTARTLTDKGRRTVRMDQVQLVKVDFPSASAAQIKSWSEAVSADFASRERTVSLDRMEAMMAIVRAQQPAQHAALRNQAPQIIFSPVAAILISVDGQPALKPVAGTDLSRVINTRPLLLRDKQGQYSLKIFDGWMGAPALTGPWTVLASHAAELDTVFKQAASAHQIDALTGQGAPDQPGPKLAQGAPAIYVATEPTELIVTDGAPQYAVIAGTRLLYVTNTTGNVFKDTTDNQTYVLVTGRWFRGPSEAGPWTYIAANALPADFRNIPDDSPKENVKAAVAGTEQSREAAIAATIPQVAAVEVQGTTLPAPKFDGAPAFRPIEGTPLAYAVNSPTPIIRVSGTSYFAVANAVWFASGTPSGPWTVTSSVPAVIYSIPASSPLFYVTFVRVYDATPTTVYVGYTPGYQGTMVDPVTGVAVYGTGYVYDPWVGEYWYGTPVTYGYAADVTYTPWTGWAVAFGVGWAWGAATTAWGWGWGPYPYWGPWAYPAWYGAAIGPHGGAVAWGPGGWAGYTGNIYTQWGNRASVTHGAAGYNAWTGNSWAARGGASYNSRTGIASAGQRGAVSNAYTGNYAAGQRGVAVGDNHVAAGRQFTAGNAYTGNEVSGGQGAVYNKTTGEVTKYGHVTGAGGTTLGHVGDDVYAGKDGNVYRNTGDGWQKYTPGGGWNSVPGSTEGQATRNATGGLGASQSSGALGGGESQHSLDEQRQARQFGDERGAQVRQSSFGMRGGFRGGGGRRR